MVTITPTVIDDLFWWEVRFDFDWSLIEAIRKIPGRWFDKGRKIWLVPADSEDELLEFLRQAAVEDLRRCAERAG